MKRISQINNTNHKLPGYQINETVISTSTTSTNFAQNKIGDIH